METFRRYISKSDLDALARRGRSAAIEQPAPIRFLGKTRIEEDLKLQLISAARGREALKIRRRR